MNGVYLSVPHVHLMHVIYVDLPFLEGNLEQEIAFGSQCP